MNILMQICGLLVVLFLFILLRSHKTLRLPSEKTFTVFLCIVFVSLLLDTLSVVAIHYRDVIPLWLLELSCKGYIISMMWVGWINFGYVSIDLNSTPQKHFRAQAILACVTCIESMVILLLPLEVYENGRIVYSYGPAVTMVYVFTLFYIVSALITALYIRRKGSVRRGFAVILTTGIWILAAAVQFLNNELLLVGFSMAIGTMILYITMENPDGNLNRRYGCFNSYALHEYIAMLLNRGKAFGVLDLSVLDVKNLESRGIAVDTAAVRFFNKLNSYHKIMLFKNDLPTMIAICEDRETMERVASDVVEMLAAYHLAVNEVAVFTFWNTDQFRTPDELLKFLTYVRSNSTARLSTFVRVSDEMINNYKNIEVVSDMIRQALAEDRVEVFYQPIYNKEEQCITSAEALARIRKRDGSLLSPGVFIPVAEQTGQIKELGERVLEKVCEFLKNSNAIELGIRCIDVNLSAVQCDDNMMAGRICKIVEKYEIDTGLINFEITETAVSRAKDTLLDNMDALVARGFSFALDDFGKGESNLIYIVEMPVKFIKLDIEMSKAYFNNPKAKHVIGSISEMAKRLGLPIVAEGIETKDEDEGISSEGIKLIQGYYYSRPLPTAEFLTYLETFRVTHMVNEDPEAVKCRPEQREPVMDDPAWLSGKRILLVEDNELNREVAQELLEDFDAEVKTAEDGTVAVEIMQNAAPGDFDFILMDIKMPYMDGFEATRRIRAIENPGIARIPILALTAYDDDDNKIMAASAGIDAMMPKPISVNKVVELASAVSVHV